MCIRDRRYDELLPGGSHRGPFSPLSCFVFLYDEFRNIIWALGGQASGLGTYEHPTIWRAPSHTCSATRVCNFRNLNPTTRHNQLKRRPHSSRLISPTGTIFQTSQSRYQSVYTYEYVFQVLRYIQTILSLTCSIQGSPSGCGLRGIPGVTQVKKEQASITVTAYVRGNMEHGVPYCPS